MPDSRRYVLMVAFHFPPCRGSSGLQRSLSFSRYLLAHGWNALVLSAHPIAYPERGNDQIGDIPSEVVVRRSFSLDTARHLAIYGRYLSWVAIPDRWISWLFFAVPSGLRLLRSYKPRVIWSTYPIATAHLIGFLLHRLSGVPWVADMRDPMTEINPRTGERAPSDPRIWKLRAWVENLVMTHASRVVFASSGAYRIYADRYPDIPRDHLAIIPNGYDEQKFAQVEKAFPKPVEVREQIVLLHSGVLYYSADRDPSGLFAALAMLKRKGSISPSTLKIVLRASGYEDQYRQLLEKWSIQDIVALEPAVAYSDALREMLAADGLLVFQGYTSNPAVPAKLYEYLRAQRPIFALVDSQGDTARVLTEAGVGTMVQLDSVEQIAEGLVLFLDEIRSGKSRVPDISHVKQFSRQSQTESLATLLNQVSGCICD